jgi:hypothetical protein
MNTFIFITLGLDRAQIYVLMNFSEMKVESQILDSS